MRRHVVQLSIAFALIALAFVSMRYARMTRETALHYERTMTLQESDEYWAGGYDAVIQQASADTPRSLLAAANAAFRKAQRDAGGALTVERLDQTLQAYTSALKNGGFNRDTAYNYEYLARLRDTVAKAPKRSPATARNAPASADDLPSGGTLHGVPGRHPPTSRGEDFDVITPMDYGEREAQPERTPGRPLPRKG
jgi:hypothetical protein